LEGIELNKHDEYCLRYQAIHDGKEEYLVSREEGKKGKAVKDETGHLFDGSNFYEKLYKPFVEWVEKKDSIRVLDFGCGKAMHLYRPYLNGKTIHQAMAGKIQSYYCYDPGYAKYAKPPHKDEKFDVVICADVMEHIPEEFVDDALKQMRRWCEPDGIGLFSISGRPAFKSFGDGENLHITMKPLDWWTDKLDNVFARRYHHEYTPNHPGGGIIRRRI
jgi:SAM-dependent methyltransferase